MKHIFFLLLLGFTTVAFQNCQREPNPNTSEGLALRPELTAADLMIGDTAAYRQSFLQDTCTYKEAFIGQERVRICTAPSGQMLIEGDIAIPNELVSFEPQNGVEARGSFLYNVRVWPGAKVYYAFSADFPSSLRNSFLAACRHWNQYTGIQFIQRTNQTNYIRVIRDGSANYSIIGCIGGAQNLSLADANIGVAIHELGHALGLIHEHQRSDRNNYVWVNPNASSGDPTNFGRFSNAYHYTSFDWNSIMLYASKPMGNTWNMLRLPNYAVFNCAIEYWRNRNSYALPSTGDINTVNYLY